MVRFLSGNELYDVIQQLSSEAKEVLWVCSQNVGLNAHEIFSQEVLKNPPSDIRFVFNVNDESVKKGEVNPYEVQYFMEHFKNSIVKSHDTFHSNIYIFDQSALLTSANLTKSDFESNIETGVLLDGALADEVKNFVSTILWEKSKQIKDLKNYKKTWNISKKKGAARNLKKPKTQTEIKPWTNEGVSTWYFVIPSQISNKTERKIRKETNWPTELGVLADIGPGSFKQLKLGDLVFIADLRKRQRKIPVEFARVFDKSRVETDEGDMHFAYETKKNYLVEETDFTKCFKMQRLDLRVQKFYLTIIN